MVCKPGIYGFQKVNLPNKALFLITGVCKSFRQSLFAVIWATFNKTLGSLEMYVIKSLPVGSFILEKEVSLPVRGH